MKQFKKSESLKKTIIEENCTGKTQRGRPPERWIDITRAALPKIAINITLKKRSVETYNKDQEKHNKSVDFEIKHNTPNWRHTKIYNKNIYKNISFVFRKTLAPKIQ